MSMTFSLANDQGGTLQGMATTFKTIMGGVAQTATLRRGRAVEIAIGPASNPAATDCNILYAVTRATATAAGTNTAGTPAYVPALEAGTPPAAGSLWGLNYTAEPTLGGSAPLAPVSVWKRPLNQHSGFHWYAPDDIGLPWPAANNVGLFFQARGLDAAANGLTVMFDIKFNE